MTFEIDEAAAAVVRKIFELYIDGWGYKKIANHLTERHIPTPRMAEKLRKEAKGEEYRAAVRPEWSIITVSEILENDFYIGTLRQGKYRRRKINGSDVKLNETEHIVFEDHHEPIIEYRTFTDAKENLEKRTTTNYRGVKKYDNVYSGYMVCGDCGSPMFSMSRSDLAAAYTCGTYHKQGLKGCTSHHTRVDLLDDLLKSYVQKVKDGSQSMMSELETSLAASEPRVNESKTTIDALKKQIDDAKDEMKILARQQAKEILRNPARESAIDDMYNEMLDDLASRIDGLTRQIELVSDRANSIIRVSRLAKTVTEVFDGILTKPKLDKRDIGFIIEKIVIYEDRIEIKLKADIDVLLKTGELPVAVEAGEEAANFKPGTENIENRIVLKTPKHRDKVLGVNVISGGSPSRIRIVLRISLGITTRPRSSMRRTIPVAFIVVVLPFACEDTAVLRHYYPRQ
jgi:hypothetical protein